MPRKRKKQTRQNTLPLALVVIGALLMVGALVLVANPGLLSGAAPTPTQAAAARIPFPDVERVSLQDAKAAFDLKSAVFLDVRGEPFYSEGHIPGALNISEEELPARLTELDKSAWIITYCT